MPSQFQKSSPPGLTRWSILACGAQMPVEALRKHRFDMDCRIKSGNDERERTKEISEAKRRQTQ
jgi:uncharacterized OsmC-like protein